jgi:hypothetical protein
MRIENPVCRNDAAHEIEETFVLNLNATDGRQKRACWCTTCEGYTALVKVSDE